jgi:hypothetical protein
LTFGAKWERVFVMLIMFIVLFLGGIVLAAIGNSKDWQQ